MQSIKSFSTRSGGNAYLVAIRNFRRDIEYTWFQLDTGASISLVGLNSLVGQRHHEQECLKRIVEKYIRDGAIAGDNEPQTITREKIKVYPGKISGVSVAGTSPIVFYFHLYLGEISLPVLGYDFLDDCSYNHSIGGEIVVKSMANDIGKRFYPNEVLDFDDILDEYYMM